MSNERYQGIFFDYFGNLKDIRQEGKVHHLLTDTLFTVMSGVLCGHDEWDNIHTWALEETSLEWLRKYIALPHGIPSLSTIKRVFSWIRPAEFSACFTDWMSASLTLPDKDIVSIDGKTSCGSKGEDLRALHMVNALCHSHGLVIGQTKTDQKSNEITAIPKLLKSLMIEGCIVTIDAMGCQKKIVEHIVEKNKADYVIGLKGNQGTLHNEVKEYFTDLEQTGELQSVIKRNAKESNISVHSTSEKGHGRIEKRTYLYSTDLDWMIDAKKDWIKLTGVGMVIREVNYLSNPAKQTNEISYYIGSVNQVADFAKAVRNHWGVESMHWCLDVTFGDDANQTKESTAAENLTIMKRIVFNVLKHETKIKSKLSKPKKRIVAANNIGYRDELIKLAFNQG